MVSGGQLDTQDAARVEEIAQYAVLGVPPRRDLQALVALAAQICEVPSAVINLITASEQVLIAAVGMDPSVCAREDSMCAVSIAEPRPVVVADAAADPRFAHNPFVDGRIDRVRFYAAAQLRDPDGHALGTLCVFDDRVRELGPDQREALDKLARMVVEVLELHRHGHLVRRALADARRASAELARSNAALREFAGQVSHDLKNPLTGVLGFVAMLSEIPAVATDPDGKRCVDRALSSATRMWRLIEDVLSHAALGGRPAFAQVPLETVARQVVEDVATAIAASTAVCARKSAGQEILNSTFSIT